MGFLLVGIGGILGALSRFGVGKAVAAKVKGSFPIGTFLINLSGAFLLGIITALDPGRHAILLMADGFLGAFTTFSTFVQEGFQLIRGRQTANACVYIAVSLAIGIPGYLAGAFVGSLLRGPSY